MATGLGSAPDGTSERFSPDNPGAAFANRALGLEPAAEDAARVGPERAADLRRDAAAGPRSNALKHGLATTTLLAAVLGGDRLEAIRAQLVREYRPTSFVEHLLIAEVARHAAALELIERAEPAVMRQAVRVTTQFVGLDDDAEAAIDTQFAAAVTSEPLERCARYRRGREKALLAALDKLRSFRAGSASPAPSWSPTGFTTPPAPATDPRRMSEPNASQLDLQTRAGCTAYLRSWVTPRWRCPRCRGLAAWWLASRRTFECRECGMHVGLRHGLVFDRSRLPLVTWFLAIRIFAARGDIAAAELAPLIGLRRLATVGGMLRRMRAACWDYPRVDRFAGLLDHLLPTADRGDADWSDLPNGAGHASPPPRPPKSRRQRPLRRRTRPH